MFKHILVPVDGSDSAALAVEKAKGLAQAFGSAVTLLYVMDPFPFHAASADFAAGQSAYESAASVVAKEVVATACAELEAGKVQARTQIVKSHVVWRAILEAAALDGTDLIVMGSQGRNAIEKMVIGSVAQRVVSHAHLPVLVVRN